MEIKTQKHSISVTSKEDSIALGHKIVWTEPGLDIIEITASSEEAVQMPEIYIKLDQPAVDIHGTWYTRSGNNKNVLVDWGVQVKTTTTTIAPIVSYFNSEGQNRLTVSLSDALNTAYIQTGVSEETTRLSFTATLFKDPVKKMKEYSVQLRVDIRDIPYYDSIKDVSKWWEAFEELKPIEVPEAARLPIYSSWYSFHQHLTDESLEEISRQAVDYGFRTIIVDDGWQTDDTNRGYAYCGDWQVCPSKIKDMQQHVKNVQSLGMKYALWYSVPFIGQKSGAWEMFKEKFLFVIDWLGAGVLDPRYPDVRKYLIDTYLDAVKNWNLDGFKLDFVDNFTLKETTPETSTAPGKDFESLPEAVDCLLSSIVTELKKINKDILIEFRQAYVGPAMRKYGNMFRVSDCPLDINTNRVGSVDIRLLSGNTPAHADMIIWNPEDTVESAALNIINVLFAVPQISILFDKYPQEHLDMLKFWMSFWTEHRDVLLDGEFCPYYPQKLYPVIEAETEQKKVTAYYSNNCLRTGSHLPAKYIIVNGTLGNSVILDVEANFGFKTVTYGNCKGEILKTENVIFTKGVWKLEISPAGFIIIEGR
jgi:alpha-galactosidase